MEFFAKLVAVGNVISVNRNRNGVSESVNKREVVLQTLESRQSQQVAFCAPQQFVVSVFGQQAVDFPESIGAYVCAQLSFTATRTSDGNRYFQNVTVTRYSFPGEQQV